MPTPDTDSWKEKYLGLLDALEREQQTHAQDEKALRQAMSRLSLAVDTRDKPLNDQLELLRKIIRGDGTILQIQRLMEDISDSILRIEKEHGIADSIQAALREIDQRLETIQLPVALRKPTRAFKKGLGSASKTADPLDALEVYSNYLTSVIEWLSTQPTDDKPGLLGRLFNRTDDGSADVAPEPQAPADETQRHCDPAAAHSEAHHPLLPPFNRVLFDLMNRLHVPIELSPQAQRICERLYETPSARLADESVVDIADLMARSRLQVEQEKRDIEQFLSQLTERLQELDQELGNSAGQRERASAQGSAIDASVSAEVARIRRSVAEAQDIGGLQSEIRAHLDNIQMHMDARKQLEQDQLKQAETEITHLRQALTKVESESQDLRERLHDARERALHDALTGLHNRLAYDEQIEQECERWARYQRPAVVSLWDVDHFKRINDEFGHATGDNALRAVAKLLQECTRKSDFIARFGGEEFMLIFPETDLDTALELANRLRERVAGKRFQYRGKPVPLTISCGLAELIEGDTPDEIYHRADQALYQAKETGRNRCVVFGTDSHIASQ